MICSGFPSQADRRKLEACARRQREDHGIAPAGEGSVAKILGLMFAQYDASP